MFFYFLVPCCFLFREFSVLGYLLSTSYDIVPGCKNLYTCLRKRKSTLLLSSVYLSAYINPHLYDCEMYLCVPDCVCIFVYINAYQYMYIDLLTFAYFSNKSPIVCLNCSNFSSKRTSFFIWFYQSFIWPVFDILAFSINNNSPVSCFPSRYSCQFSS